jgi:hypothetical protein
MNRTAKAATAPAPLPEDYNYLGAGERKFEQLAEGRYRFTLVAAGVEFEVDRLRRERDELVGELTVRCAISGALTVNGTLSVADFNFSSLRARQDRARHLRDRARTQDRELDWQHALDDLIYRVVDAERKGVPAVSLRDVPRPTVDDNLNVDGFPLLRRNPVIWFADGATSKSYLALYVAGRLEQRGMRTLFADWEWTPEEHRVRLEALFGADMPDVTYARCDKPIADERDRLQRIIRDKGVQFVIIDSIAAACGGPPESAEFANRFMQSVRQFKTGSLMLAHVNKSESGDRKPFGSSFWHNNARSTWFIQRSEEGSDEHRILATMFHRKSNGGPLRQPIGYEILFANDRAEVTLVDATNVPGAAEKMKLADRIAAELRHGRKPVADLADVLDVDAETVRTTGKRGKRRFTYTMDASGVYYLGLLERRGIEAIDVG